MRNVHATLALAVSMFTSAAFAAEKAITPPKEAPAVGRNLQVPTSVKITEAAPEGGLELTVTSDDPTRLLLARLPNQPGSASIKVRVNPHRSESQDFFVRALDDKGEATYTASAPGFASGKGTVRLSRSAILMYAPLRAPVLVTTPAVSQRVTVETVLIGATGKPLERQITAGPVEVELISSDPKVGTFTPSKITIPEADISASTEFKPVGTGNITLSVKLPPGFSTPSENATLAARVDLPGLGIAGEIPLGKDLQTRGVLLLGEPAPKGGVDVTLTSSDPSKMVVSAAKDKPGAASVTLHVPEGAMRMPYFLQALAGEGVVKYSASAPGYRERVAPVNLMPSGVLIAYAAHGAPDEAEYLRPTVKIDRPFIAYLGKPAEHVAVWTVFLDPQTRRGADMTAQPLRPGMKVKVELASSDPAVGAIPASVVLDDHSESKIVEFTALKAGETVLSMKSPEGFTPASNAQTINVTVK